MSQLEKTFLITKSQLNSLMSHVEFLKNGTNSPYNHNEFTLLGHLDNTMNWAGADIEKILSYVKECPAK